MLKKLSDNLNMFMAAARLNSSELARQTGIPAGTIKRIRNNNANPTIETLLPIAKHFAIAISDLIGDAPLNAAITIGLKKIPLFSWRECLQLDQMNYDHHAKYILTERQVGKKSFALQIEDDDLEGFSRDTFIIIDPEIKPASGDYVIVSKASLRAVAIRKYISEIDCVYLKPVVKGLDITPLTQECRVLGVIIQAKMELHKETN